MDTPKRLAGTTLVIGPDDTISWDQLEKFFGRDYIYFKRWMEGQTVTFNGAYAWDVRQYIKGNRETTD